MKKPWIYAIKDVETIVFPYKAASFTAGSLNRYAYSCETEAKAIKALYYAIHALPVRNGKKKIKKKLIEFEDRYMLSHPEVFI